MDRTVPPGYGIALDKRRIARRKLSARKSTDGVTRQLERGAGGAGPSGGVKDDDDEWRRQLRSRYAAACDNDASEEATRPPDATMPSMMDAGVTIAPDEDASPSAEEEEEAEEGATAVPAPEVSLPDEVLQLLFSHLSDASDLQACAATSAGWRRASEHTYVWRALYESRWGRGQAEAAAAEAEEEEGWQWKRMALDRAWREKQVVGILDYMVWPPRRSQARERLRTLFAPPAADDTPGDTAAAAESRRRHRFVCAAFALDKEVGWNREKQLSRRRHAFVAKMHVTEFDVCAQLRDRFRATDNRSEESCVERCERGAILIARLLDNDLDASAVTAALDKLGAEFQGTVEDVVQDESLLPLHKGGSTERLQALPNRRRREPGL
jgi:hypothetical protein